jgi:hypothetical protein
VSAIKTVPFKEKKNGLIVLKELTSILYSMRNVIVQKPEEKEKIEVKPKSLYDKLGAMEGIK